jgi:hypothetical protein
MREGIEKEEFEASSTDKNDEDPREGIVEFYIIFKMYFN